MVERLQAENSKLFDRLLLLAGRPDATGDHLSPVVPQPGPADGSPERLKTEEDEIEGEELTMRRLNAMAERELEKFADDRGIPVDAVRDV